MKYEQCQPVTLPHPTFTDLLTSKGRPTRRTAITTILDLRTLVALAMGRESSQSNRPELELTWIYDLLTVT
jgi:hypothetical protein